MRLRQVRDREIDYSDIPATSREFWARAALVLPPRKVPVSLRLDEDILAWFKSQGVRYQTRMNAVLRAFVDSLTPAAGRVLGRREILLGQLTEAERNYKALTHLPRAVPPGFFARIRSRIESEGATSRPLKLPVLFFFLVRRDLASLRGFDEFLGRLTQGHRKHLLNRLRTEEGYTHAAGAIFEVDVLAMLLARAPAGAVGLYPRIGATGNRAEASIRLGQKSVYIEVTLLSHTEEQERIRDIGVESAYGSAPPSEWEMRKLGLSGVQEGVVTETGDPYSDGLRVVGKLDGKRRQLHPGAPNLICLGLADLEPDIISVERGANDVFSGSPTMARTVLDRTKDGQQRDTLTKLIADFGPEPKLTGVLTFQVEGSRVSPLKAFRNPAAGLANCLEGGEWNSILALFGFHGTAVLRGSGVQGERGQPRSD